MPTTIAIIIGVIIGVLLSSIAWSIFAIKMNNDWADKCRWVNQEWEMFTEKIIIRAFDDIREHLPEPKEGE